MQNKIDKIGLAIIVLTIVLLNIFIGASIQETIWIAQVIISTFTVVYIIVKRVKKEKHIVIKSKIDVIVLLFMLSTMIPYLAKTYATLEGTINCICKYWSVYSFYILIRNIVITDKRKTIVWNTIIISSMIPIIIGFDKLAFNLLGNVLEAIKVLNLEDSRMISNFGYANTYALYLTLTSTLAIAQLLNGNSKKKKAFYIIYILIAAICIMFTQSKAVLALIVIVIGVFTVKGIKDKKISKKWIVLGLIGILAFLVYFFIAIQISKPLEVLEREKICVIRGIEPNKEYKFELDIEAQTKKEYDTFDIFVMEVSKFFSEETLKKISFSNFNGIKTIEFRTGENIDHIEMKMTNHLGQKLTINGLKINGKPYILEYKIIPDELVRIFTTFNFKNSSVWQRVDYWKDGLKVVADNVILGSGGSTWSMLYGQKQEYLYYAQEVHSYPLEVWMSFGMLGMISYLLIVIITLHNGMKLLKKNKEKTENYRNILAIVISIILIIVHSAIDFDMSFLIIEAIFFTMVAVLNEEDKRIDKNLRIIDVLVGIILLVVSIGNLLGFSAQIIQDETYKKNTQIARWGSTNQYKKIAYMVNHKIEDEDKIESIKEYIKNEPYQNQNIMYKVLVDEVIKSKDIEDIQFLINTWKKVEVERKYEVEQLQDRIEIMLRLAKGLIEEEKDKNDIQLKELAKEILEIIQKEYSENRNIMLEYERNHQGKTIAQYKYMYYTNSYNSAIKLLKQMQ